MNIFIVIMVVLFEMRSYFVSQVIIRLYSQKKKEMNKETV